MIAFFNSLLSYIVVLLIIVVVASIGFTIGLKLRKNKDKQNASQIQEDK